MTDLTTQYLGLYLKNPIVAASSSYTGNIKHLIELEKEGVSAVVLKSIFEEEIINDLHHNMDMDDKFHSSLEFLDYYDYDLKKESLDKYIQLIKEAKQELTIPVIASINCVTSQDWTDFAVQFEKAGADALELNIFILPSDNQKSAQDIENEYINIIKKVKSSISIPVSVKMSHYFTHISEMIHKLDQTGISGLVLFNRSYSPDIDIDKMEISSSNIFSSPDDFTLPLRWIALNSGQVNCSLAASTGIHDSSSVIKLLLAGADVIQLASTIFINGPEQVTKILSELETWMGKHKFLNIDQFRGKLTNDNKNPAEFERVQFMKYFGNKKV
jgi:dihydroorotate dehydrogenase (fumarate)